MQIGDLLTLVDKNGVFSATGRLVNCGTHRAIVICNDNGYRITEPFTYLGIDTVPDNLVDDALRVALVFRKGFEPQPVTYSKGQRFKLAGEEYILASVGGNSEMCLINVRSGNRNSDSVRVGNMMMVTKDELEKLSGRFSGVAVLMKGQ